MMFLFIPMYTLCVCPQKSFMITRASVWSVSEQIWNIWCSCISLMRCIKNTWTSSFQFVLPFYSLAWPEKQNSCNAWWKSPGAPPGVWFHVEDGTPPPCNYRQLEWAKPETSSGSIPPNVDASFKRPFFLHSK